MDEHHQLSQQATQQQQLVHEIVQEIMAQIKPTEKKVTMTDRNVMILLKLFDGVGEVNTLSKRKVTNQDSVES